MPLGNVEEGLGPGHIVLDGDPAPPPIFGPCLLWANGWMDQDATWYEGTLRPMPHCITWGSSSPQKGAQSPIFGPCLLWPNGRPSQLLLSTCHHSFREECTDRPTACELILLSITLTFRRYDGG